MSSYTYNADNLTKAQEQDGSKNAQQQMIDGLTQMNQSFNSSVNNSLGLKSLGDYAEQGLEASTNGMSMAGNAVSSIKDTVFNTVDAQQAMNSYHLSAGQANQIKKVAKEAIEFVAKNSEALALV